MSIPMEQLIRKNKRLNPRPPTDLELAQQEITEKDLAIIEMGQAVTEQELNAIAQGQAMTDLELMILGGTSHV